MILVGSTGVVKSISVDRKGVAELISIDKTMPMGDQIFPVNL